MTAFDQQTSPVSGSHFPVTWEDPADALLSWTYDPQFYPDPVTPMTWSVMEAAMLPGWNRAMAGYGMPVRLSMRRINTYLYQLHAPPAPHTEPAIGDGHGEERLDAAITRLGELWNEELLPEIKEHLAYWETFDLHRATLPALLAHLNETMARRERLVEMEMLAGPPGLRALSDFDDLYADLFGSAAAGDALRLVQGLDNKTVETDQALWQLSGRSLAEPRVRQCIITAAPAAVVAALAAVPEGPAFLAALDEYLAEYGQRSNLYMELAHPFWIEDPTPVIAYLQDHLSSPERDPAAGLQARAAERERLVAAAREHLRGYPAPVRAAFERLLRAAQYGTIVAEDHNYCFGQEHIAHCWSGGGDS